MRPIDVILLTHNRLPHLVRTVDALLERTPEPIRLTVVDNASGPDVRNWLAGNRERFERLILRPTNEHMPAVQHGIEATDSDPCVVTDPDLVIPDMKPSWLARQVELMERHPDFGMIAVDLDDESLPPALDASDRDAIQAFRGDARPVAADLIEGNVGTVFLTVRRSALRGPWVRDDVAARRMREAGYRVGWNPLVKAHHLGSADLVSYPDHLLRKSRVRGYVTYQRLLREVARPPTLAELAQAGPIVAETRAAGIPDRSLLELAWRAPAVGPAVEGPVTLLDPPGPRLPLKDDAAGAVVLLDPPDDRARELLEEAFRVAARLVVASMPLGALGGAMAHGIAPRGWHGLERSGIGDVALSLAREGDHSPALRERLGLATLEHREDWLSAFAAQAFGPGERRLFVFRAADTGGIPPMVRYDPELVRPWRASRPAHDLLSGKHREAGDRPARSVARELLARTAAALPPRARRIVRRPRRPRGA